MITRLNREQVLCTNEQQEFFEAQQALSHAGIAFRTEARDNTRRLARTAGRHGHPRAVSA